MGCIGQVGPDAYNARRVAITAGLVHGRVAPYQADPILRPHPVLDHRPAWPSGLAYEAGPTDSGCTGR